MKKLLSNLPTLLKLSYQGWKEDRASRLSAALAYYTIFSLAPMLVIVIAITGLLWEADVVRTQILNQVQGLVGAEGSDFISGLITSTGTPARGYICHDYRYHYPAFWCVGCFQRTTQLSQYYLGYQERKRPKVFFKPSKRSLLTVCFLSQ